MIFVALYIVGLCATYLSLLKIEEHSKCGLDTSERQDIFLMSIVWFLTVPFLIFGTCFFLLKAFLDKIAGVK